MKFAARAVLILLLPLCAGAQVRDAFINQPDTSFYKSYANKITGRFFFSQKYTRLNYSSKSEGYSLDYRPNTNLNMGIGATYKWATLNIAYGFPFMNQDSEKGKTDHLDLQFHGYGAKIQVDGFGQFYRGFFLTPKGAAAKPGEYYQRPDIRVNQVGLSVQYILNHRHFSFRAAFLQNDWQRKSAGSLLFGFETYAGRIKADSSFVPRAILKSDVNSQETFRSYFELGPNLGYAYTCVIREHFFVTGALSLSLDYGVSTSETGLGKTWSNGFSSNTFVRFVGGYNSELNGFSFSYVNNGVSLSPQQDRHTTLNTGNFRMTFTHRFTPGNKEKRFLRRIIK